MPIYEFHCKKCGKDSEVLLATSDWEGTKCPECGATQLEKKLSVFAAASSEPAASCDPDSCNSCPMRHRH